MLEVRQAATKEGWRVLKVTQAATKEGSSAFLQPESKVARGVEKLVRRGRKSWLSSGIARFQRSRQRGRC